MKPEFKLEGDVLKIKVSQQFSVDKDGDGVASVKGGVDLWVDADASEVAGELLKSDAIMEKIKAKLGM